MTQARIRRRARTEHRRIREHLRRLERAAGRILQGEGDAALRELERQTAALRMGLAEHLAWEDEEAPQLLRGGPRSEEAISWMWSTHREIREVLDFCHRSCGGSSSRLLLARRALDLVRLLRSTLAAEERASTGAASPGEDAEAFDPGPRRLQADRQARRGAPK